MHKRIIAILTLCLIFIFGSGISFSMDKVADKVEIKIISPAKPNAKATRAKVDTTPVVVRGIIPVEIGKIGSKEDIQSGRYLVEYFIDGNLACKIDGSGEEDANNAAFKWILDTAKYENGKHKLIANFWDKEGSSGIGIVYVIIDNPLSVEDIKEVTAGE